MNDLTRFVFTDSNGGALSVLDAGLPRCSLCIDADDNTVDLTVPAARILASVLLQWADDQDPTVLHE